MMGFGYGFGSGFDSGFGVGFGAFEILFMLTFFLIAAAFVVMLVRGIGEWNRNNHSPRITVPATVVSRRTQVSHHHHRHRHAGETMHTHASTS